MIEFRLVHQKYAREPIAPLIIKGAIGSPPMKTMAAVREALNFNASLTAAMVFMGGSLPNLERVDL